MACRQCDDLIAPPEEVGIGADDERASSLVNKRGKSGSHVMLPAGVHDNESLVDGLRRGLRFAQVVPGFFGIFRVHEIADRRARWRQLQGNFQPLCHQGAVNKAMPVALPPGRLKLATKPELIGSLWLRNTIGVVELAAMAAREELPPVVTMTATRR